MTAVFLLLDAFRFDYLSKEYTPFLWESAQKGEHYERVIPSLGFCERSEILSGLKPAETGFLTAIGYDPADSPFSKFRHLLFLEPFFPGVYRRFVRKFSDGMNTYEIPSSLLEYWNLTEDKIDHRLDEAFSSPTILSLLKKSGKSYFYDSFTALNLQPNGTDQNRMQMVINNARDLKYELYMIYISAPDILGHEYGPLSHEFCYGISVMDRDIKIFTEKFKRIRPESTFVFLGDHGMAPVTSYVDVGSELLSLANSLGLRLKKDFIYFLDSTLLRVWFFSKKAKRIFEKSLRKLLLLSKNGLFIDEMFARQYYIPWNDQRYGDFKWLANEGVLIFPDFFHSKKPYKGMHGYDPSLSSSQGTCILYGDTISKKKIRSIELTDMYQILRRLLKL